MSKLILPRPENVRGRFGSYVTGDMYDIALRLQELDKRLVVQAYEPPVTQFGRTYNFAIVEVGQDGVERLVMRVQELDARVIERCERMLRIPFAQRFEAAEKENEKWEEEQKQKQLDELYEKMGGNMRIQLERCGFTDPWGPKYAPMNRTARRHRRYGSANGVPAR